LKGDVFVITEESSGYPELLKERMGKSYPKILYCNGNVSLLSTKNIAVVGSRMTNDRGLKIERKIINSLIEAKFNIVSGYARGVDMTAHETALSSGGTTTAVISEGIDNLRIKNSIKEDINKENTLFVSQFEPGMVWKPGLAMARNKLVVALSEALIVVSAGPKKDSNGKMSGTFNAAEYALKIGIPVMVVSNKLLGENYEGNNDLIKKGAIELNGSKKIIDIILENKPSIKPQQDKLF